MNRQTHQKDSSWLAARVAKNLTADHRLAYAHLSAEFVIEQLSPNFNALIIDGGTIRVGKPITDFIWELVGLEEALRDVLAGKAPELWLQRVTRQQENGKNRYYDFSIISAHDEDPAEGLLLIIEDVTEVGILEKNLVQDRNELRLTQDILAKTNNELHRLNRLKSLFLAMAAHDLRSPLTAMRGYVHLLQSLLPDKPGDEGLEFTGIILEQIDRLNRLIEDFLALDQIDQGKLKIKPGPYDLKKILVDITNEMEQVAVRKQISLSISVPEDEIPVFVDPERIRQVFYNLLGNAIKYTPQGGEVRVSGQKLVNQGEFRVIDSGKGMTEAELSNLFQIYYRTEDARESKTEGTGLGLYIVKSLVDAHQGQIDVTSKRGQGTAFIVRLPAESPAVPTRANKDTL